jgi:1-acyl-sn-glycerol-3-phosphate acyltransferase
MFYLRLAAGLTAFAAASIYAILLALIRRDRSLVPRDYGRAMEKLMHPVLGLQVRVHGEENLRQARPCVYVVNHQSAFDVPILSGIYPEDTVLIAKKELRKLPLFGWIYEATGNILIDRAHNQSAVQRLREASDAIRERGVSIWIFPEGTRGKVPGELLPFKKGAFHVALDAGVPLVPIVVSPVLTLFDVKRRRIRKGIAQIRVLEPVSTEGYSEADVPELMAEVHHRMATALRELPSYVAGGKERLPLHTT